MKTSERTLFAELSDYEQKGVLLLLDDAPASPMQILRTHACDGERSLMRDYVMNEWGDVKSLCFTDVKR